ncbi:MAG TPA: hypothetical protein VKA36_01920 [Solirubrobacterales bacterium]|nr:hypothetical protein [Solirubrobacterales bacterium]
MKRSRVVISRAIDLGRGRLPFLFGLAALIFVPLGFLEAAEETVGTIDTDEIGNGGELATAIATTAVHIVSALVGEILYTGAVAIAVVSTARGVDPSLPRIVRTTRWATLIAIDVLFAIGTLIGLLLFLVPGLVFFGRYALVAVVAEIEELGVRASFRRSAELSRGARRLILVLILGAVTIGEVVGEAVKAAFERLTADHFLLDWITASSAEVLLNPAVALLSVALVLELGGRPAHGTAGLAPSESVDGPVEEAS